MLLAVRVSIYEHLLAIVPRVARICSSVIFHSSPEGVLIMTDEDGEYTKIDSSSEVDRWRNSKDFEALVAASRDALGRDDKGETELMVEKALHRVIEHPEHLVVNCWRSVREVALLLGGSLTREALLTTPRAPMLNVEQLQLIAEFFIVQLLRSRHPGAFELTASGFQSFCEILLKVQDYEIVNQWPQQWLSVVVAGLTDSIILPVITTTGYLPMKYLCATRRSAGLPFFIQTLLVALHKADRIGDLLNQTVDAFIAEANKEVEATTVPSACAGQSSLPVIERRLHAMNVLKTLVRDATTGPLMGVHLEAILICALHGLDSSYWMLRNSGLMLYSAMMERIFGVNRTRDCESKKNRMAASVFFTKFPGLRGFLLKALKEAVGELSSPDVVRTKLFSILNVLKRLLPPIQQATTDGNIVHAFVPLVFRCAGAADIRIRLLGAKALVALLQPASLPRVAYRLLLDVSPSLLRSNTAIQEPRLRTNLIHGMLVQVLEIMKSEYWPSHDASALQNGPHFEQLTNISSILSRLASKCFSSSSNICPIVRQACLACFLAFGPSPARPVVEIKAYDTPSSSTLDAATSELLVHFQDALKNMNSSLIYLVKNVLNGSNLELKRLTLGLLVLYVNGHDIDFSKLGRLFWYEDVANLLSELSSSPYRFNNNERRLDVSACVPQLVEAVITSQDRPYQPYSLIGFHASQLLAYQTITASSNKSTLADWLPNLTSQVPKHLGPLLTVKALTSEGKDKVLDLLSSCMDLKNPEIHWSIRAEALLALFRLLSQERDSVVRNFPINLATLKSLVSERDDEVLLIAATTASKMLAEADQYPREPLPFVILPQFLSNFISEFGEAAITSVLDWLQEDLLTDQSGGTEVVSRVFVTEELTVSNIVELATFFCLAVRKWVQIASSSERVTFITRELHCRGLTELPGGSFSEMDFSRMGKLKALRRSVTHLFKNLISDFKKMNTC